MARRATLDRRMSHGTDDDSLPPDPAPARRRRPAKSQWGGSGGRWLVWVLRAVAWLVLLLIGYRGVTAIISGSTTTPTAPAPSASPGGSAFPQTLAEAYALQFGDVYLNFSPATANRRASQLAAFLPSGTDDQLGWNGAGIARLQSEQVASVQVRNAHSAVVTLLASVNGQQLELGVPVYADDGKLVVSGQPALLPAPARATVPQSPAVNSDQATETALLSQLPQFFRAYASGDQLTLDRFLASGATVTGLNGAVNYGSLQSVTVPYGGTTRVITAVVDWTVPSAVTSSHSPAGSAATLQMTYSMTVVREGTSWYVRSIGASPQSPGPP
jgi:conjugative transposon protein TcpC